MTVLGILGCTHDPEFRRRYHYPLELLRELILEFRPSVLCGEVLPASYERYLATGGRFEDYPGTPASEYWELVLPLCREARIEFVPIDWFELDVWPRFDWFAAMPPGERDILDQALAEMDAGIRETWPAGSIPFNSDAYDDLCRAKYDWLREVDPAAYAVQWDCRNRIMAARVEAALHSHPGERVLCLTGADHTHFLHDLLREGDRELLYPLRP